MEVQIIYMLSMPYRVDKPVETVVISDLHVQNSENAIIIIVTNDGMSHNYNALISGPPLK